MKRNVRSTPYGREVVNLLQSQMHNDNEMKKKQIDGRKTKNVQTQVKIK